MVSLLMNGRQMNIPRADSAFNLQDPAGDNKIDASFLCEYINDFILTNPG